MTGENYLQEILRENESAILDEWVKAQLQAITLRTDLLSNVGVKQQSVDFFNVFQMAVKSGEMTDIFSQQWEAVRSVLEKISKTRSMQSFTSTETATFIFSLKQTLFSQLEKALGNDSKTLAKEIWTTSLLLDRLGLYTTEIFLKSREEVIKRQQEEMFELSTPVIKLWEQILAIPLIGTLDSARTQVIMENLLQEIVNTSSSVAIIDITGVPTVDTMVAQHLIKTVSAARLMGAECVISGIRPQIAQTMVHLGIAFDDIITRATLADALKYALSRTGLAITKLDAKA